MHNAGTDNVGFSGRIGRHCLGRGGGALDIMLGGRGHRKPVKKVTEAGGRMCTKSARKEVGAARRPHPPARRFRACMWEIKNGFHGSTKERTLDPFRMALPLWWQNAWNETKIQVSEHCTSKRGYNLPPVHTQDPPSASLPAAAAAAAAAAAIGRSRNQSQSSCTGSGKRQRQTRPRPKVVIATDLSSRCPLARPCRPG